MNFSFKQYIFSITAACMLSGTAFAHSSNGLYLGLQGGASNSSYDDMSAKDLQKLFDASVPLTAKESGSNNPTGRLYLGYQFNPYLSTELGYAYLGSENFKNINGFSNLKGDLDEQATDISAKVKLPLPLGLNVFALGGLAYVNVSSSDVKGSANQFVGLSDSNTTNTWTGTYGLGAGWDIGHHLGIDTEWRRYVETSSTPETNAFTIGLSLHL